MSAKLRHFPQNLKYILTLYIILKLNLKFGPQNLMNRYYTFIQNNFISQCNIKSSDTSEQYLLIFNFQNLKKKINKT